MKTIFCTGAMPLLLAACGDALVGNNYLGEPLARVRGDLEIAGGARSNDTLQVDLIWNVDAAVDYKINQSTTVDPTLGRYEVNLLVPPPDDALNVDPETQGRIGFANILAYDDPRAEGPLDLSKVDPKDYRSLVYRFRGGSPDVLLVYAKDRFPAGSRIATALGGAVEPGFHLVRSGPCRCPISDAPCTDGQGQACVGVNTLVVLDLATEVPLTIVEDITTFSLVKAPGWLF